MKTLKIIALTIFIIMISFNIYAEGTKKDCSIIKAKTGMKMYDAWKCKMGKEDGEPLGKKIKKLFKKKS